ncbi:MAG: hypothetical protein KF799_03390 [Bdellovibrionales bacterium]|nr:hypothetical protein [Bdellovibrionales bacterium]
MLVSLAKLIAITAGVLILTVFAVVFVRWVGAQQQFADPPHVWFEKSEWNVTLPPLETLCQNPRFTSNDIVMVPIHRSKSGEWQIPCSTPMALSAVLEKSPQVDWLLKIDATDIIDLDKLVDSVSKFDQTKRFAVYAPAQIVARHLRKRAPQWLYAADTGSLLRLHLFSSLQLASVIDIWPDFFVASAKKENGSLLNVDEVEELHRRKKRILWDTTVDAEKNPEFPIDGRLTRSP